MPFLSWRRSEQCSNATFECAGNLIKTSPHITEFIGNQNRNDINIYTPYVPMTYAITVNWTKLQSKTIIVWKHIVIFISDGVNFELIQGIV